ncbi:MAG TPA: GNAT family N-acetyltransferase [Syntrophorhabdaceae bacterium]|nr:GNAT family N-acetyltransferase [Syntrophorhabdaceae bacterium]
MDIVIERMNQSDVEQVEKIQTENQRIRLDASQQEAGFLSIAFSREELKGFNNSICVAVAKDMKTVAGYCCVSNADYNARFPILDQIVANLSYFSIGQSKHPIDRTNTSIYGPVCVAAPYRNKGILKRLSSFAMARAKEAGYLYCLSFISPENVRSMEAHLRLSFFSIGSVHLNNREYLVMGHNL